MACVLAIGLWALVATEQHAGATSQPPSPAFTGTAEIDGPLHLQITVTPPVSRPKDEITVMLTITSRLDHPVAPTIEISLPDLVQPTMARFPAATAVDYQHSTLSWQPFIDVDGETESLSLQVGSSIADVTHPEQEIEVRLHHDGETKTATVSFWIGSPPSAHITVDRPVVAVGQVVTLQAVAGGPGPFTATWDLGDGRHVKADEAEVAYAAPGIYDVRLQLANPLSVATALTAVSVVSQPTAAFSLDDDLPVVGQSVQFTNESGGERPMTSQWTFGDGGESQEVNPAHMFTAPGTYMVGLVVTSQYGQSETYIPVTVGVNPVADLVIPDRALTGEPFEAMAFSDDTVIGMTWQMGDGTEYEGSSITHTYFRPADYAVRLIVENAFGVTELSKTLRVDGSPYAHFLPVVIQEQRIEGVTVSTQRPTEWPGGEGTPAETEDLPEVVELPIVTPAENENMPVPGGAAATPHVNMQPIALPPQSELATDASVAEQLLWYVNEARRLHGLLPLTYNYELSIAAQQHTLDMSQNPDIMHIGSDGSRPAERQRRYGYFGAYGGEAVAWGWESPVPVVEFWVNSPPHRTLILNPEADEIGVGHTADGRASNIWYWAVEFGVLPNN